MPASLENTELSQIWATGLHPAGRRGTADPTIRAGQIEKSAQLWAHRCQPWRKLATRCDRSDCAIWDCPFSLHTGNPWRRASVLTSSVFAGVPKQPSTKQKWCLFNHYRGCRSEIWITAFHCGWSENDTCCYGPVFRGELNTFLWWYFQLSCSQLWILNPLNAVKSSRA